MHENLLSIISSFLVDTSSIKKDLLEWIPKDRLNIDFLCKNPNALSVVEEIEDKRWDLILQNYGMGSLLLKEYRENGTVKFNTFFQFYEHNMWYEQVSNKEKLYFLCINPTAIPIIEDIYKKNPDDDRIDWYNLCLNENAIHIIEEEMKRNISNIKWGFLCANPEAIHIIEKQDIKKINMYSLSKNPNAKSLLEKQYITDKKKLEWKKICSNPGAISIIEKEYENDNDSPFIKWTELSGNINAKNILIKEYERNEGIKFNWYSICQNPCAISIIEKELEKQASNIWWTSLCSNPEAIHIIEKIYKNDKNDIRLNWYNISINPKAIDILETEYKTNPYCKIRFDYLSSNPSIFILNKDKIKEEKNRLFKILNEGGN